MVDHEGGLDEVRLAQLLEAGLHHVPHRLEGGHVWGLIDGGVD
jgi:hypothetical protein